MFDFNLGFLSQKKFLLHKGFCRTRTKVAELEKQGKTFTLGFEIFEISKCYIYLIFLVV